MKNGDKTFYFGVDFLKENWYKTKRTFGVRPAHQYQNSSQYKILLVFTIFFLLLD